MTTEADIQLRQEGTGPSVRTLELVEPSAVDAAGEAQADSTRHQQVVALADRRGDLDRSTFEAEALPLLREIADALAAIRLALS